MDIVSRRSIFNLNFSLLMILCHLQLYDVFDSTEKKKKKNNLKGFSAKNLSSKKLTTLNSFKSNLANDFRSTKTTQPQALAGFSAWETKLIVRS